MIKRCSRKGGESDIHGSLTRYGLGVQVQWITHVIRMLRWNLHNLSCPNSSPPFSPRLVIERVNRFLTYTWLSTRVPTCHTHASLPSRSIGSSHELSTLSSLFHVSAPSRTPRVLASSCPPSFHRPRRTNSVAPRHALRSSSQPEEKKLPSGGSSPSPSAWERREETPFSWVFPLSRRGRGEKKLPNGGLREARWRLAWSESSPQVSGHTFHTRRRWRLRCAQCRCTGWRNGAAS